MGLWWTEPAFSRKQVTNAGKALVTPGISATQRAEARAIVDNWRAAHGFPLNTVQMTLRNRARKVSPAALIAQRTKRLPSIQQKLKRFPNMALATMQDIGGCRAILPSVAEVRNLEGSYSRSQSRSKLVRRDDYIGNPKKDGYRGVHLVIEYSGTGAQAAFSGMKIEIQLRTQAMHAWATAVEVVDLFTRQGIKSGQGDKEWRRFFVLMSSYMAAQEGTPQAPGCPEDEGELRDEIRNLAESLDVVERLTRFGHTLDVAGDVAQRMRNKGYYVLSLNVAEMKLSLLSYPSATQAESVYGSLEDESMEPGQTTDVVMVSVESAEALRRAYPNYFLDTGVFLAFVTDAIA